MPRRNRTYIALIRAINVGGRNALPMNSLVAILEGLGALNVRTYIQSGNAVFEAAKIDPVKFANRIAAEISKRHGFEPHTQILGLETLKKAVSKNPFPEAVSNPASLHLGFLASRPENPDVKKLAFLKKESEQFQLGDGVFYIYAPEGVGKSRLAAGAEKALGVPLTDRNWRTVCKLVEMSEDHDWAWQRK